MRHLATGTLAALFLTAAANATAADLKAPLVKAPPVPPVYNWTGCHVGIEGGGVFGKSRDIQNDPRFGGLGLTLTGDFNVSGALLGGTAGCDYQFANWVIGVEDDFSWTNLKGHGNLIPPFTPAANTSETNAKWLDTLRLRFGTAFFDRGFLYATGGAAFSQIGINLCSPLAVGCGSASSDKTGWTVGAGVEYALWSNWSAKLEYLYVDLGTTSFPELVRPMVAGGNGAFIARNVKLTENVVRAGLNYKFDLFAPVSSRY